LQLRLAVHRLALNLPVTGKSPWTAIEVCWQLGLAEHLKSDDRRTTGREQGKSDCHHWSEMALLKSEGRSGDGSIPRLTIIKILTKTIKLRSYSMHSSRMERKFYTQKNGRPRYFWSTLKFSFSPKSNTVGREICREAEAIQRRTDRGQVKASRSCIYRRFTKVKSRADNVWNFICPAGPNLTPRSCVT
jgi:hypothetical protein